MSARLPRLAVLAAALLAATAATAAAQPTGTTAAPQTHDWNDVSHINGQPVPVGESSSYEKEFRRKNIAINPIGLLAGYFGVSASVAINDHVAIRVDANYFRPINASMEGFELGAGVPLYLRRTYQGAFLEPGVIVHETRRADGMQCAGCVDDSESTMGPQVLFGWHWTWDSGLNVAAAVGVGRDVTEDSELFGNGYFRVGYSF